MNSITIQKQIEDRRQDLREEKSMNMYAAKAGGYPNTHDESRLRNEIAGLKIVLQALKEIEEIR